MARNKDFFFFFFLHFLSVTSNITDAVLVSMVAEECNTIKQSWNTFTKVETNSQFYILSQNTFSEGSGCLLILILALRVTFDPKYHQTFWHRYHDTPLLISSSCTLFITINSHSSQPFPLTSGVRQGSVLGPPSLLPPKPNPSLWRPKQLSSLLSFPHPSRSGTYCPRLHPPLPSTFHTSPVSAPPSHPTPEPS